MLICSQEPRLENLQSVTEVSVTNPIVVNSGHIVYTVSTKARISLSLSLSIPASSALPCMIAHLTVVQFSARDRTGQTRCYHRYSDFDKLNQKLQSMLHRSCVFPPFPPKSWISARSGRFVGISENAVVLSRHSSAAEYYSASVLQDRCSKLNDWLNGILKIPALVHNEGCSALLVTFFLYGEVLLSTSLSLYISSFSARRRM
jgi:hypothetical protein